MIVLGILLLVLVFKLSWFLLKLCGAILGSFLSVIGFVLLGLIAVPLGIVILSIPVLAVVGLIAIISGIIRGASA